jgi:sarcosine oxidase subunit delta
MKARPPASHTRPAERTMLRIPCPYCGVRDEPEFVFGGPANLIRPVADSTDAEWTDYLFNRDNLKGIQWERWLHAHGCERWLIVSRDTSTHEIHSVCVLGSQTSVAGRSAL